jgi:hypothetical protein
VGGMRRSGSRQWRRQTSSTPGRGRYVSMFLDKNRRYTGESQSKQPPKRTQRPPHPPHPWAGRRSAPAQRAEPRPRSGACPRGAPACAAASRAPRRTRHSGAAPAPARVPPPPPPSRVHHHLSRRRRHRPPAGGGRRSRLSATASTPGSYERRPHHAVCAGHMAFRAAGCQAHLQRLDPGTEVRPAMPCVQVQPHISSVRAPTILNCW